MPPLDVPALLNPGHWFNPNPGPPSPYTVLAALLLVAGLAASVYFAFIHVRGRYASHAYKAAVFGRFGQAFAGACAIGLVLVAARFAGIPFLSLRALLYLDFIAILALAGFAIYYFGRLYPVRLAAYDARVLRQRYLPRPGTGKGSKRGRPKKDHRRP